MCNVRVALGYRLGHPSTSDDPACEILENYTWMMDSIRNNGAIQYICLLVIKIFYGLLVKC